MSFVVKNLTFDCFLLPLFYFSPKRIFAKDTFRILYKQARNYTIKNFRSIFTQTHSAIKIFM